MVAELQEILVRQLFSSHTVYLHHQQSIGCLVGAVNFPQLDMIVYIIAIKVEWNAWRNIISKRFFKLSEMIQQK